MCLWLMCFKSFYVGGIGTVIIKIIKWNQNSHRLIDLFIVLTSPYETDIKAEAKQLKNEVC